MERPKKFNTFYDTTVFTPDPEIERSIFFYIVIHKPNHLDHCSRGRKVPNFQISIEIDNFQPWSNGMNVKRSKKFQYELKLQK